MRLADFIQSNIEPILAEWVDFARTITPERDTTVLRDHAPEILRAAARDMVAPQSKEQSADKSKGGGAGEARSRVLDKASEAHAVGRADSGFDMVQLLAEYRALRASVIRLWRETLPDPDWGQLDELTRFNEAIDQSVAEAVHAYTEHVDESRETFLAMLGHDLRSPLAAMKFTGEVLQLNQDLDAKASKMAQQMVKTAEQMDQMVHDLLDFAVTRLGRGIPIVTSDMDLGRLCRDVVAQMQAAHPSSTIRYTSHGDLSGKWDARRLWQVVSNLLDNAIQYGSTHAPVEVSVIGETLEVVINVHNEGEPIAADKHYLVFRPMFHRVDHGSAARPGSTRRPGSVGLGLCILCAKL